MKFPAFLNPRHAVLDAFVLFGAIVLANISLAPRDLGFLHLNPSPFLLAPILLGSRYGFRAGFLGGAAAAALIVVSRRALEGEAFTVALDRYPALLASLVIAGAAVGEVQAYFDRKLSAAAIENGTLVERVKKLAADHRFLMESKDELERVFAVRDNEHSAMDTEVRKLFSLPKDDLYAGFLLLLSRQTRISEAAVYTRSANDGVLERKASLGNSDQLPERIEPGQVELADLCVSHKAMTRVIEAWESKTDYQGPYLMAVPLIDVQDDVIGAVLVTGMPFVAMNDKTLRKVGTLCRWCAQILQLKTDDQVRHRLLKAYPDKRVYYTDTFKTALALSIRSMSQHGVPSSVVSYCLPGATEEAQDSLETAIMKTARDGDYATHIENGGANLHILLPLTGERGATIFLERCGAVIDAYPELAGKVTARLTNLQRLDSETEIWASLEAFSQ